MAKGIKTGGKDFEAGNTFGGGRPSLPEDVKQAKKLNRVQIERALSTFLQKTKGELALIDSDPSTTSLERFVISIITNGIKHGDQARLNFLFDRIIGKVKEEVDLNVYPKPMIIKRLDGSEIVLTTDAELLDHDTTDGN